MHTDTTTRRAVLRLGTGALAYGASAAAVTASGFAISRAHAATPHPMIAELDALDRMTRRLDADPNASEAQWEEWERWQADVYRRAEALPEKAENNPVRLRAIKSIYLDGPVMPDKDVYGTTDARLAAQIVRALAEA